MSAEQRAGLEVLRVSLFQVRQTITRILHLIEDVDPVDIVQLRVSTAGGVTLGEYLERFREEYRSTMT